MEFHECLTKLMDERGVNQAQLCKLTGIATSAMSHYVRGETDPSFSKAIQIARALNVPLDALAGKNMGAEEAVAGPSPLSGEEEELLDLCRRMDGQSRETLLNTARSFAALAGVGQERSGKAAGQLVR